MASIDWKQLTHAHGPATRVPTRLKQLVGKAAQKRIDAFDNLRDVLVGAGAWYPASAPAITWLLEALPKAPQPELVLTLVAEILGADHLRGWLLPPGEAVAESAAASFEAAAAQAELLVGALASEKPASRAAAALVLAQLPALTQVSRPPLVAAAESDPDEVARASALLALGRLGGDNEAAGAAIGAARGAEQLLVRGAAAVAWLRLDGGHAWAEVAEQLRAWLTWEPPIADPDKPWLPWFGGLAVAWYAMNQPLDATSYGVAALAREREQCGELAQLCLDYARAGGLGIEARRIGRLLLELGGFLARPEREVVPFEELSPGEQEIARGLAETTLLPTAGHGLVAAGAARRRWAGLAPAGPLEQEVSLIEGEPPVPLWRAFVKLRQRGYVGPRALPPELDKLVSGCDRWQVIAELSARTYFMGCQPYPELFEEELSAIEQNEALWERAAAVADDLAQRYAAAARDELGSFPQLGTSAWLLLPLTRAGRAIEPRWEPLLSFSPPRIPLARELLGAVPVERRPLLIRGYLTQAVPPFALRSLIEAVLPLADLSPTPATAEAILAAIESYRAQPHAEADAVLEAFEAHGRKHPALGEAIAAARQARG